MKPVLKKLSSIASAAVVIVSVSGCVTNEQAGTVLGGGLGALVGSQFGSGTGQLVTLGVGAVGGAWLGNSIGQKLDEASLAEAERTTVSALENNDLNETSSWSKPAAKASGTVTPTYDKVEQGSYCRDFQTTVTIDGTQEAATGTACRQADGKWVIEG